MRTCISCDTDNSADCRTPDGYAICPPCLLRIVADELGDAPAHDRQQILDDFGIIIGSRQIVDDERRIADELEVRDLFREGKWIG